MVCFFDKNGGCEKKGSCIIFPTVNYQTTKTTIFRMSPESFDYLLSILGPTIEKKTTHLRETLPPPERLAMTLRLLATGDSQASMSYAYRVGRSTVSTIIAEVSDAIWNVHFPSHETEWKAI